MWPLVKTQPSPLYVLVYCQGHVLACHIGEDVYVCAMVRPTGEEFIYIPKKIKLKKKQSGSSLIRGCSISTPPTTTVL